MDKHFIRNGLIFASTVLLFFLIGNIMKKRILIFLFSFVVLCSYCQTVDDFVGTWRYENNDTVFTIVLKEGKYINDYYNNITSKSTYIFGGYSLSVNGKMIDDFSITGDCYRAFNVNEIDISYHKVMEQIITIQEGENRNDESKE